MQCQGGDFTKGNGTGGESIYGEKFAVRSSSPFHCRKATELGMVRRCDEIWMLIMDTRSYQLQQQVSQHILLTLVTSVFGL
jgi:hypothetical protein